MRKMLKQLNVLLFLTCSLNSFAAEIDSYTNRNQVIWDASYYINRKIQNGLTKSVKVFNEKKFRCPRNVTETLELYDIIKENLHQPYKAHAIADFYHKNLHPNFKISTDLDDSIYQDLSYYDGFSTNYKGLVSILKIEGREGRINAIGTDKLDHFLIEGWLYFEKAYLELGETIEDSLEWGRFTENTYYGKTTTGVFSHADLAANFNGMRFFNHIFGIFIDPLNEDFTRDNAYIGCRQGKWSINSKKLFFINDYVDPSWDEAVNCNEYSSESIEKKVARRVSLLENRDDIIGEGNIFCPIKLDACDDIREYYGEYASSMISPICDSGNETFQTLDIIENDFMEELAPLISQTEDSTN